MKKIVGIVSVLSVMGMSALAWSSRAPAMVSMDELNAATAVRINAHVQKLVREQHLVASRIGER